MTANNKSMNGLSELYCFRVKNANRFARIFACRQGGRRRRAFAHLGGQRGRTAKIPQKYRGFYSEAVSEPCGLVHLYTGDGKGKTTAAAGLAVRAAGAGKKVLFCQFLKGAESCELSGLRSLGIEAVKAQRSKKFLFKMDEAEREQARRDHNECFSAVSARILAGEFGIVVLDEVVDAVNCGLISEDSLLGLLESRPKGVEIVMTGREPGERLIAAADYHTDFVCKKHPYQKGVPARRGIEY